MIIVEDNLISHAFVCLIANLAKISIPAKEIYAKTFLIVLIKFSISSYKLSNDEQLTSML
jgi:hypothetical protein